MIIQVSHPSTARVALRTAVLHRFAAHALESMAAAAMLVVFAVLTALASPATAWAAEPWPQIPLPPKAEVQWVAQSMRVNGVPTRVMTFQSRVSRGEIVEYYRAHWSGGYEHPASLHALGDSTVVGQKHGPYLLTVKVEDAAHGASQGLISVAQVVGSKEDLAPGELPLMNGAHVVSVVESDDPGKHSRAVMIIGPQPPSSVAQFYQASLVNAGWLKVQGTDGRGTAGGPQGSFTAFARGDSEMQLSIVEARSGRGSTLLANLVTKDTGPGAF